MLTPFLLFFFFSVAATAYGGFMPFFASFSPMGATAFESILPILALFFVSIAALAYGTYTDLRERIVSNWVTYGMLALGLIGHAVWAFVVQDMMVFAFSAFAAAAMFAFSYALYKAGVWAGGDVKLFTGLAALNPVNPALLSRLGILGEAFFKPVELPIFPFTLFMFSLFAMLPYGAALAAARLAKNRAEKNKFLRESRQRIMQTIEFAAIAVGLNSVLSFFGISSLLVLPLLFVSAFVAKKPRAVLAVGLLAAALWLDAFSSLEQLAFLVFAFLLVYFLFKLYALSKVLLRKPVPIAGLQEGMISAVTIVQYGKKVEILQDEGIKKLIKQFVANKSGKAIQLRQTKGKVVVASNNAAGLSGQEISALKRLAAENRIPKKLLVKESAPFVPAVLIAFIALNVVGDVIWFWLL